jgi:hypothetical protein
MVLWNLVKRRGATITIVTMAKSLHQTPAARRFDEFSGKVILQKGLKLGERGLLMLYLLDPKGAEIDELEGADPVVAWAISFPSSNSDRTVSNSKYIGNSVLWGGLNEWLD